MRELCSIYQRGRQRVLSWRCGDLKQVVMGGGQARVVDVPAPAVQPGCVLVRTAISCISTGTELAGFRATRQNPVLAALRNPALRKKGLDLVRRQGLAGARS